MISHYSHCISFIFNSQPKCRHKLTHSNADFNNCLLEFPNSLNDTRVRIRDRETKTTAINKKE